MRNAALEVASILAPSEREALWRKAEEDADVAIRRSAINWLSQIHGEAGSDMGFLRDRLSTPFARKCGTIIVFATVTLLIANPELVSVVLLVNMIGVDVFVLLVGIQLRQNWSVINAYIVMPCYLWLRKRLKRE